MDSPLPVLSGLRVVEFVHGNSGALLCGRMLAQLGADVMMVEPPQGHALRRSGLSLPAGHTDTFETAARGKRSVVQDLQQPQDADSLADAILEADVLLVDREGLDALSRAGAMRRVDHAPALITCCVSPFGLTGPHAHVPGSELTVQAVAGVLLTNGEEGDPPLLAGVPVAACGGASFALIALLAALWERARSGRGQLIDQSQYDAVVGFQGTLVPGYLLTGEDLARMGNRHALTAPWNHFRTRDGWIVVNTVGNEQWRSLAQLIGHGELADDERYRAPVGRLRHIEDMDALIGAWTARFDTAEALARLAQAQVPASAILTLGQGLQDPQARHRMLQSKGSEHAARLPFRFEGAADPAWAAVPLMGGSACEWHGPRFTLDVPASTGAQGGPLQGVRVMDIGVLTAGPLVGRLLGMLGADVVKVESPRGERTRMMGQQIAGTSYLYYLNNTDKRSCTLDLGTAQGRDSLRRLCARADVFVTNLGEQTLQAMGASFEDLRAANPHLVYAATSGFGRSGPRRGVKAFDTTIQASIGIMSLTGMPEGHPLKVGLSIVDLLAALSTAAGAIAGLIAQRRGGGAVLVDASLLDAGLWATQAHWPAYFALGQEPARRGCRHRDEAPHNCFRAADGWVALAIENDAQWQAWASLARCTATDLDRFGHVQQRLEHVDAVEALVSAWMRERTAADAVDQCTRAGIPASIVSTLSQAVEHPLTQARELIVVRSKPSVGSIRLIGAPMRMSRSRIAVQSVAPDLGEHNEQVLSLLEQA